jgi:CheY-like chemotaxis protein
VAAVLQKSVLIVDEDDVRRRALSQALAARGERCLDVADGFAAMAACGRADFSFVIAAEGRRRLSLRGLCQLARKRHPDIPIFIVPREGSSPADLQSALGIPVDVVDPEPHVERLATHILGRALAINEDEATRPGLTPHPVRASDPKASSYNPFDGPDIEVDDDPDSLLSAATVSSGAPARSAEQIDPNAARRLPTEPLAAAVTEEEPTQKLRLHAGEPHPDETTQVDSLRPSSMTHSDPTTDAVVVVDGQFDDVSGGAGAALMMSLFAQELTGRLVVVQGEAQGTLYLHRGEPVWADDPAGDAGLYRKLVQKGFLPPELPIDPVPEGSLLGSLMAAGVLGADRMQAFMREVVRDRVIALATQQLGEYRFTEDRSFLETAPLLKLNPFGLILDSRRRQLPPPALMALQGEIESLYAIPGPGLGAASEKIRPFLRGGRAVDLIDGRGTVRALLDATGLDPFMGTLVVVVMRDARLIALEQHARVQEVDLNDSSFDEIAIDFGVDDDEPPAPPASAAEAAAREDIWALYMRLKPLTQPRQVLGVSMDATDAEVDAAYRARLAELDVRRIPEGSAQHMLAQRVNELRRKVDNAWQTLKMQTGGSDPGVNNPF